MPVIVINNQIHLIGEINKQLTNQFINKFELALSYPSNNIELHISSPGGSIKFANNIIDIIQLSYKKVDVYIHHTPYYPGVASAASVIASYANQKVIDHDATFLIHHARTNNIVDENEDDVLYWVEKTGLDYDIVDNLLKTERKMDAKLAYSFGFVDNINYNNYTIPCI